MAKQRNSLGVIVLPIPYERLTVEEYKSHYGIDLNEIFAIRNNSTHFKKGFSKLIAIDTSEFFPDGDVIPLSLITEARAVGTQLVLPISLENSNGDIVPSYGLAIDLENDEVSYYEL